MSLNPVKASREIFKRFLSYITTTFRLSSAELNIQIEQALREPGKFAKGPILEIIPPFLTGKNVAELIELGVLHPSFRKLQTDSLPLERPLFFHQEQAIKIICEEQKSAVVATGTGSGKTESFMIPILNHLFEEKEQGVLAPGVRALLLYPMNALANDQIKRLRTLLANQPQITFGIYTGETEERQHNALEKYLRMFHLEPLPNEIICRERMRLAPPHILLTNYAMLEYLMLRPADNVFFQGKYASNWKFIVLDEAHTYTGAKGIEMAMLLSRLKNAIGAEKGELRFVLTSASLGKGQEDAELVARFAARICGEEITASQVITATQQEYSAQKTEAWGKPQPVLYQKLQNWMKMVPEKRINMEESLREAGVPDFKVKEFINLAEHNAPKALFSLLRGDIRLGQIIALVSNGPVDLHLLAKEVFGNGAKAVQYAASFLDLCNQARLRSEDKALLPARFHFFVKALEGAFIAFTPKPQISLERVKWINEADREYKAFELGACTRCHGLYLIGEIVPNAEDGYSYLEPVANDYNMESNRYLEFFALADEVSHIPANEDDVMEGLGLNFPDFKHYRLCVYCGGIASENDGDVCKCNAARTIQLIKVNHKGRAVHKCGLCGSISSRVGVVRRFYLSEDAISSVLSTALYQELPGREIKPQTISKNSIFGSSLEMAATVERRKIKQLLVFSDSRQNAAFFAPYLSTTYGELLARNLLIRTLDEYRKECIENKWSLVDYNRRVRQLVNRLEVLTESDETLEELVWQWIMREFAMETGQFSLERMGLLIFLPDFERVKNCELLWNFKSLKDVGINPIEARILYTFLLEQFRRNRAVEFPEMVSPNDPFFAPQNQQGGFWSKKPPGVKSQPGGYNLRGWLPADGFTNTRLDYLRKILEVGNVSDAEIKAEQLLHDLWQTFIDPLSPLLDYIETETLSGQGKIYKLDPSLYKVVPARNNPDVIFYRCDSCHRITQFNLGNVCPAYRCEGKLRPINLEKELEANHYRNLHLQMKPEAMVAHEHTAQLATEYAAQVQTNFIHGKINVLSCSTTFELGVDVGELETVFMKNVPPTPANYAQRAGRAGRRIDTTAFALTFARLASHDFNQFSAPGKMISGVVKPPHFDINNEKIGRRHLYACAFAHFWRIYPAYFRKVEDFFCSDGPKLFREYLNRKPIQLLETLQEVFSEDLQQKLGIRNWSWVEDMYDERGVMTKVVAEIEQDLREIDEAIEYALADEKYTFAGRLKRIKKTIVTRPLINFLAQRSLLPKYGFPVDVVNLDVNLHTSEGKNVDLSRDMQIAIAEYAPDSQVVANGKLWTSRYVKRVSSRELVRYRYIQCSCGYFHKDLDVEQSLETRCPICGERQSHSSVFVVPEFGFIAEDKPKEPGTKRPERTYACRKFFSGAGDLIDSTEMHFGSNKVKVSTQTHGILTVVNNGFGGGFYLCRICGYGTCENKPPQEHKDSFRRKCLGSFEKVSLGYDLETDIAQIDCFQALRGARRASGYWESLLYSLIEGMSQELEIDRNDLDGTIYVDQNGRRSLILFDTVPGGAGQVKRILEQDVLEAVLYSTVELLERCSCGGKRGDTSCYGCLRNYQNQFVHDCLRRDYALDALKRILDKG